MSHPTRVLFGGVTLLFIVLGCAALAAAQTGTPIPAPPPADAPRPATTTFFGDTGLWYVPTAEVLPHGKWSASLYRRGTDYLQGHTNVADFAATFGMGFKRMEIFGSFLVDTRIDRDATPVFFNDAAQGGIVDRNPRVNQPWTGNSVGDLYVGTKVNLTSQSRGDAVALAVRGMIKIPTGRTNAGVSTGKSDALLDVIVSKEVARSALISGFAGYDFRGSPDAIAIPTGAFRWGVGAAFPSRSSLRMFTELNGSRPTSNTATILTPSEVTGEFSTPPDISTTKAQTRTTIGLLYQAPMGVFFGTGLSLSLPRRDPLASDPSVGPANWDWQFRIGFHPTMHRRARVLRPRLEPASPMAPAAATPAALATPDVVPTLPVQPALPTLTVKAECDLCTVEVGTTSRVTAIGRDSTGCSLTYRWTVTAGALADATQRSTIWTAPGQDRVVPVTVTATCPTDGRTAADTVDIQTTKPPVKTYTFDDVYFDFDRGTSLRPDAMRILDEAVSAMRHDATLTVTVEGYTDNIGTDVYNLALGNRRAVVVRDYLVAHGVSADRIQTVSFGEARAKFGNGREETRQMNRRAAVVVTLLQR